MACVIEAYSNGDYRELSTPKKKKSLEESLDELNLDIRDRFWILNRMSKFFRTKDPFDLIESSLDEGYETFIKRGKAMTLFALSLGVAREEVRNVSSN